MKKLLIMLLLCCFVMTGCGAEGEPPEKVIETEQKEGTAQNSDKPENDEQTQEKELLESEIDNSNNHMNVTFNTVEDSLSKAFDDMGALLDLEDVSIYSNSIGENKIQVRISFRSSNKPLVCTGIIDVEKANSELELWDIVSSNDSNHYYWISEENHVLEDNTIIRDGNYRTLYDFNTEKPLKSQSDLPTGNLANASQKELVEILMSALSDIGFDGDLGEVSIESREHDGILSMKSAELYFYIGSKHLAAEYSDTGEGWVLREVSLYDDPDYYYWISPQITTMWGTSLHKLDTDEQIELDELSYDNYNEYLSKKSGEQLPEHEEGNVETMGEKNALAKAKDYLEFSAFSYSGLIEQLEYEKFSHEEAVYGADNCGADWNEQAAKKARDYLDLTAFSRDGLIEQLQYEGFTHEQAVYGVEQNGY